MNTLHTQLVNPLQRDLTNPPRVARKRLVKLTEADAERVFEQRCAPEFRDTKLRSAMSLRLAKELSVSVKTIRDVWNRKTWQHASYNVMLRRAGHSSASSVDDMLFLWNHDGCPGLVDPFSKDLSKLYAPYLRHGAPS